MIIDMGGSSGSYIDAMCGGEAFMPVQPRNQVPLSPQGQAAWAMTQQHHQDVIYGVSQIIQAREYIKNVGAYKDDVSIYYVNSFTAILEAGDIMQNYIMACPTMQTAYYKGYDVYPDYVMPEHSRVYYDQAMDSIVQFDEVDTETISQSFTYGYDDIPDITSRDQHNLNMTYKYIKEHMAKNIRKLLLE